MMLLLSFAGIMLLYLAATVLSGALGFALWWALMKWVDSIYGKFK